jgi:hypothetical protein
MRREPEFLGENDGVLVYIARKLREALALEQLLTESGVDYVVEADHYYGGFIFQTARIGAFFYVRPDAVDLTRDLLVRNGYRPYKPQG